MGFSRQEYWSGLPIPSPGDLPWIEPTSPALQADSYQLSYEGSPVSLGLLLKPVQEEIEISVTGFTEFPFDLLMIRVVKGEAQVRK